MKSDNYYLRRIWKNWTHGSDTYKSVKELFVSNLSSMGVDCSTDNGMTTLANKILEIEQSIVADLDTSCELESQSATVTVGNDIVLSCKVNADYDTSTVDLKGNLQNANVDFYLGDTLLGTEVTNSNGVATYNYTTSEIGNLSFKSQFNGTDNFDECESNTVSITVSKATPSLSISASSSTIQIGGTSTISGVLADGDVKIENATIKLYDGSDTLIDTLTTNANGEYSKTIQFDSVGEYSYYAVFDGDSSYNSVTSDTVSVTVEEESYTEIVWNGSSIVSPNVTVDYRSSNGKSFIPISGESLIIDYGDGTVTTSNGSLNHTYTDGLTTHTIKVKNIQMVNVLGFYQCTGLQSIKLEEGVTVIMDYAFNGCSNLESIYVPNSIQRIYNDSLKNTSNLRLVTFNWTEITDDLVEHCYYNTGRYDVPNNITFSIPPNTTSIYNQLNYPSDKLVERSE